MWALADGRQVVGSRFHATTNGKQLPDLRAMFLGGANDERQDAMADTAFRALGDSQGWATAKPRAAWTIGSARIHTHNYPVDGAGHVGRGLVHMLLVALQTWHTDRSQCSKAGAHTHDLGGGDSETRQNNVSVSYFVRINR
jgi:hypothetical protein